MSENAGVYKQSWRSFLGGGALFYGAAVLFLLVGLGVVDDDGRFSSLVSRFWVPLFVGASGMAVAATALRIAGSMVISDRGVVVPTWRGRGSQLDWDAIDRVRIVEKDISGGSVSFETSTGKPVSVSLSIFRDREALVEDLRSRAPVPSDPA